MSDPFEDRSLPRGALAGAAALVTIALAGALFGAWQDTPPRLPLQRSSRRISCASRSQ